MGISEGFQELGAEGEGDCSAGSIVWVRRRNGSWWPGKIVGEDELSPSHLASPRSGTPVKLLGREDASVDWYNLEKSKRVKAFRCGEFDDCIDKAEKSQGVPIKKREKYARREDAILHAIELERQQLVKKQKTLVNANSLSSKRSNILNKELGASSQSLGNGDCKFINSRSQSQSLMKELDFSPRAEGIGSPTIAQRGKHGKYSNREEDKLEAIPRTRGLQDFGLRIAPKRKAPPSVMSEGSQRPSLVNDYALVLPSGSKSFGGVDPVNSSKHLLAFKRKRTQGGLIEESPVKRRDRRRPLVQVLQSSEKLPESHNSQSDGCVSPSMQGETEQPGFICRAKRSRCVYLPAESGDSLDRTECSEEQHISEFPPQFGINSFHPNQGSLTEEATTSGSMDEESDSSRSDTDTEEEQTVLSDPIQAVPPIRGSDTGCIQRKTENLCSEEFNEAGTVNGYMYHCSHDQAASVTAAEVSKWQLKGKRNIRNLTRRPTSKTGKKADEANLLEGKGNWSNQRILGGRSRYLCSKGLSYDYDEDGVVEKSHMRNQKPGFGARRYPSLLKGVSRDHDRSKVDFVDFEEDPVWETDGLSQAAFRGYWKDSGDCFDPIYTGSHLGNEGSMLVDVDVKVRASYQGEHVPLVSLMSRLNGKAIIGHPVQVEPLEDGATDALFCTNNDFNEEAIDNDGSTALAPVWRTARRTAMHRIPRPHHSTALNSDDVDGDPLYSDPENKPLSSRSLALYPDWKAGSKLDSWRPAQKKGPKKPTKKASSSSQKTRMLSSIATEQKLNRRGGSYKAVMGGGLDGLIKPQSGPTTVTCIPVKLVFSRLLEAVGGSPSRPANHIISNTDSKHLQGRRDQQLTDI